jgi:hypothetical protein
MHEESMSQESHDEEGEELVVLQREQVSLLSAPASEGPVVLALDDGPWGDGEGVDSLGLTILGG